MEFYYIKISSPTGNYTPYIFKTKFISDYMHNPANTDQFIYHTWINDIQNDQEHPENIYSPTDRDKNRVFISYYTLSEYKTRILDDYFKQKTPLELALGEQSVDDVMFSLTVMAIGFIPYVGAPASITLEIGNMVYNCVQNLSPTTYQASASEVNNDHDKYVMGRNYSHWELYGMAYKWVLEKHTEYTALKSDYFYGESYERGIFAEITMEAR